MRRTGNTAAAFPAGLWKVNSADTEFDDVFFKYTVDLNPAEKMNNGASARFGYSAKGFQSVKFASPSSDPTLALASRATTLIRIAWLFAIPGAIQEN